MTRFAEGTKVPIEKSRAEIEKMVVKHNASAFSSSWTGETARIIFRMNDRFLRFDLKIPALADFERKRGGRSPTEQRDAEIRRLWRALLLSIKAKLETVDSGIESFEHVFLANIVMPDGNTVGEAAVPLIAEAYQSGRVKPLMLEAGMR